MRKFIRGFVSYHRDGFPGGGGGGPPPPLAWGGGGGGFFGGGGCDAPLVALDRVWTDFFWGGGLGHYY